MPSRQRPSSRPDNFSYLNQDTIAAYSSALGGPIGVVRVSGKESHRILAELTGDNRLLGQPARTIVRHALRSEDGSPMDDATVARFDSPRSFTGEDGFELFVHGARPVVESVLARLFSLGARRALPGEFSFRAVKNGKLSLTSAEAIADLIGAKNADAAKLALEKMSGAQQDQLARMAERIRRLAALAELGIDFSDQDVEEVSHKNLARQARAVLGDIVRLRESFARGIRLQDGVGISFLGAPNSGKSSFFNALLEEERSIVSDIAGTTRDIVRETFNLPLTGGGAITLRLEDTAGIRETKDAIEAEGVARAYRSAHAADLAVWFVEVARADEAGVLPPAEMLASPEKCVGILSKVDLVAPAEVPDILRRLSDRAGASMTWLPASAKTGSGMGEVIATLADRASSLVRREPGEVLLTREDHARYCEEAETHLARALGAPELDLFASDLRHALLALEPMIGATTPDDLLGRIFSEFCIGK